MVRPMSTRAKSFWSHARLRGLVGVALAAVGGGCSRSTVEDPNTLDAATNTANRCTIHVRGDTASGIGEFSYHQDDSIKPATLQDIVSGYDQSNGGSNVGCEHVELDDAGTGEQLSAQWSVWFETGSLASHVPFTIDDTGTSQTCTSAVIRFDHAHGANAWICSGGTITHGSPHGTFQITVSSAEPRPETPNSYVFHGHVHGVCPGNPASVPGAVTFDAKF